MIKLENYKFGYKLNNKLLPVKTHELCYLDNKSESSTHSPEKLVHKQPHQEQTSTRPL